MKRVLLTGGAGFIGSHTLEHFLENTDWHIVIADSLEHRGDMRRIEQVLSKNPAWVKRIDFHKIDLAKPIDLVTANLWGRIDYVINMAAESHVDRSIDDPAPFITNNVLLTINMLEYARIAKPDIFIQISTDEVYGPMYDKPFPEWSPLVPSNPYSASKAAQEMIAVSYWRTYSVPLIITNTMNNIGEMQDAEKYLPKVIKSIINNKHVPVHGHIENGSEIIGSRFYLHARNHADALLFLINKFAEDRPMVVRDATKVNGPAYPERFNIVGDTQLSNLELAEQVAKILDKKLSYELIPFHTTRPGHDMHYGLDGTKLHNLGWRPPVTFNEALRRTVKNYLDNPEWLD